ncbi:hypothetical protein GCM10011415_33110 [Salipiger pallidus]|uniref:TadE-like domain-containing protein n=1 Tax=Salipiger pallidus TaxID=1775170 RepID=A0A8J2ZLX2_9RHOB|nr:TadE/TadG family type IV pilus assembly protein [Salipiger pallidus]GGG81002.1 hypothetical protein GCM10011415_33110 [Salipiger pallidus]
MDSLKQIRGRMAGFLRAETGSITVETVIWLPLFLALMSAIVDISMVFHRESTMLRVIQDANRAYSVGRIASSDAVERSVLAAVTSYAENASVSTTMVDGVISTRLQVPTSDLMPIYALPAFSNRWVVVETQQFAEF